ncbi:unnamed protein product [Adineta steineri]|uniref:Uncharacterized protein n=1 Tax=Adineta steineri TaxID=433720 RepID=A0A814KV82_9BILA|nr:unnamed protein product [Adineta steineri]
MYHRITQQQKRNKYEFWTSSNKLFLILLFLSRVHCESTTRLNVNQYITDRTSSQFRNLENLIGSIHIYEPKSVIRIRDQGLTDGQRKILGNYQNTEIVPSTYVDHGGDRTILVNHELIGSENIQRFQNNGNKGDSIRKKIRLAIVIPFIRDQIMSLLEQLNASIIHTPCRNPLRSISPVNLILYHNEASNASWINDFIRTVDQYEFLNGCFGRIQVLAANLTPEENKYPIGAAYMWKRLFDEEGPTSLRSLGYTHFFLMEPDTRPIRSHWVDAIMQKIVENRQEEFISTNWWMFGSVYRGSKDIGFHFLHINGNAIYHLSSNFLDFLRLVWQSYSFALGSTLGYDLDIFQFMFNPQNYDLSKRVWHKFRYSDFIQNCWHTGCTDLERDTDTFLVHGNLEKENDDCPKMKLFWMKFFLIFIFVVLIGFFLFRSRSFRARWRRLRY